VIDGLERADLRFAVAVQWHPEDMVERVAVQRRLFEAFANEL
jgi:gamma-glutamyl-gamma-aminobutyrate hydrolase PuuD